MSKSKKHATAGESGDKRRKRNKEKLIRLNDLIPQRDVKGGQRLFGVTDPTHRNPTQNK